MPKGAKILTIERHGRQRYLCALTEPKSRYVSRTFVTYADDSVPDESTLSYLGSFDLGGKLRYRIYEKKTALAEAMNNTGTKQKSWA
jgi:hypothetical protein